jgi:hypothetical protein
MGRGSKRFGWRPPSRCCLFACLLTSCQPTLLCLHVFLSASFSICFSAGLPCYPCRGAYRASSVTRPAAAQASSAFTRSAAGSAPAAQAFSRAATGESRSARASGRASAWNSAGRRCSNHFWWYASACRSAASAHDAT